MTYKEDPKYVREKNKLKKTFLKKPSQGDVNWGLLNAELIKTASERNWSLFRNVKLNI